MVCGIHRKIGQRGREAALVICSSGGDEHEGLGLRKQRVKKGCVQATWSSN